MMFTMRLKFQNRFLWAVPLLQYLIKMYFTILLKNIIYYERTILLQKDNIGFSVQQEAVSTPSEQGSFSQLPGCRYGV